MREIKLNRFQNISSVLMLLLFVNACAMKETIRKTASSAGSGTGLFLDTAKNALPVEVGKCGQDLNSLTASDSTNINTPCVSVTVCVPGTSTCQTVPNILLDTGSYGLRVFTDVLGASVRNGLTQMKDGSGKAVVECAQFAIGSDWGPVKQADVILGNEDPIRQLPIQVIDKSFSAVPTACESPDIGPNSAGYHGAQAAGFNGILGVGLKKNDCPSCTDPNNIVEGQYYSCTLITGTNKCSPTLLPTAIALEAAKQVSNPIPYLNVDNNGIVLSLGSVPQEGATSVSGYAYFGIGTRANNSSSSVSVLRADSYANFSTKFNGTLYSGFIDSGSNGLFFPSSITQCSSGFYCPTSIQQLFAYHIGYGSSSSDVSHKVLFQILNADTISSKIDSNNYFVFNNLGAPGSDFDWGLPFFLGRTVYIGIEGMSSHLGVGPFWAY